MAANGQNTRPQTIVIVKMPYAFSVMKNLHEGNKPFFLFLPLDRFFTIRYIEADQFLAEIFEFWYPLSELTKKLSYGAIFRFS